MFAFAIYDLKKCVMFLARDHIGQKPLIYANTGKRFLFASEIPALLAVENGLRRISPRGIHLFLTNNLWHIPEPYSAFERIEKLEPAHCLLVHGDGRVEKRRYWDLGYEKSGEGFGALSEKVLETHSRNIDRMSRCDVPFATFLSGGLDSTSVALLLKKINKGIEAFTIGSSESHPDISRSREIARLNGMKQNVYLFDKGKTKAITLDILEKLGEPYFHISALLSYEICREVRKHGYKVIFTGAGGDELFYGYDNWRFMTTQRALNLVDLLQKALKRIAYGLSGNSTGLRFLFADMEKRRGEPFRASGQALRAYYSEGMKKALEGFDEGGIVDGLYGDRKSTRLNSSHRLTSRMPSSA
jgi:asparagine synthase (glutamine-hydrolysing)